MPTVRSPSSDASHRVAAARLPIEEPVEDFAEAVRTLRTCDATDLRRARQHHRRALESLENGGYSGLSDTTRARLVDRLRTNLMALNRALDTAPDATGDADSTQGSSGSDSFSSRFRALLPSLW